MNFVEETKIYPRVNNTNQFEQFHKTLLALEWSDIKSVLGWRHKARCQGAWRHIVRPDIGPCDVTQERKTRKKKNCLALRNGRLKLGLTWRWIAVIYVKKSIFSGW